MKAKEVFHSWKEIADYLERDVRTCHRWERELGLPVHRIEDASLRSRIFAYKKEIDNWLKRKSRDKGGGIVISAISKKWIYPALLSVLIIWVVLNSVKLLVLKSPPESTIPTPEVAQAFDKLDSSAYQHFDNYIDYDYISSKLKEENNNPKELYNEGNYYLSKAYPESNELAVALFLKSLRLDNDFAPSCIGLAQGYINFIKFEWDYDEKWLDLAEKQVNKAKNSENPLPGYYSTKAEIELLKYLEFRYETLDSAFLHCLGGLQRYPDDFRLNSIMGECHFYRFGQDGDLSDFQQAYEYKRRGFWLKPYSLDNTTYIDILLLKSDFEEAARVCSQIASIDPTLRTKLKLAEIYYYSGELVQSEIILRELIAPLKFKMVALLINGMIAAQRKDTGTALSFIHEIELISLDLYGLKDNDLKTSSIYFGLGLNDEGYKHLKVMLKRPIFQRRLHIIKRYILLDKNFGEVREEKEFHRLIQFSLNNS